MNVLTFIVLKDGDDGIDDDNGNDDGIDDGIG